MNNAFSEKWYSLNDLNRAFNMGLESAVFVLENAEGLTPNGLRYLTESLKKIIGERYDMDPLCPCKGHGQRRRVNPI